MRRGLNRIGTVVMLMVFVGACGDGAGEAASPESAASVRYPELAAMLPEDVRERGTLKTAMSADYPPDHFTENGVLTGFDPDISRALGDALGIRFELVGTNFEGIIPGLQARRYDVAVSTVFITPERQRVVDFISYFNSGSSLVVKSGSDLGIRELGDVCGHRAAIEKGTAAVEDLQKQSDACVRDGKPAVRVQTYAKQSEANLALLSGQADVLAFNSSAAGYAAKQNPQFEVVKQYASFMSGIIVPKGQTQLAKAIEAAVTKLIEDGTYLRILEKWGMQAGAITDPEILPAPS